MVRSVIQTLYQKFINIIKLGLKSYWKCDKIFFFFFREAISTVRTFMSRFKANKFSATKKKKKKTDYADTQFYVKKSFKALRDLIKKSF